MNLAFTLTTITLALCIPFAAHASPKISFHDSVYVVDGPFGGTLVSSMTSEISSASFSGELRSAVYDNGSSGTDIYYQLVNNSSSISPIGSINQSGSGSVDLFISGNGFTGAWTEQTNAVFGVFTVGTAKAGMTWNYLYGHCTDITCQDQGSSYSTQTEFVGDGFIPGTEILTGVAPGTASYTGMVYAGANGFPNYVVGTLLVDGQSVSAFVATVPEPESYAMLLAGLGVIGFGILRSKKSNDLRLGELQLLGVSTG
jgi:hypothetical protein